MLNKDLAICIQAFDYSETSQVLTLFTKEFGKIRAIAKGSKRLKSSFDGPVEVFSFGRVVFSQSSGDKLSTLTEFEQQPIFDGLTGSLFALNSALFASELLQKLTKDYDPYPQLFDSFFQFLLNTGKLPVAGDLRRAAVTLLILFQLTLLREVGLGPVLNQCVNCKTPFSSKSIRHALFFSSSAAGLVCRDCETLFVDRVMLSRRASDTLTKIKNVTDTDVNVLDEIENVLIRHFTTIFGKRTQMARYIEAPTNLENLKNLS